MVDHTTPLRNVKSDALGASDASGTATEGFPDGAKINEALTRVRSEIEHIVDSFDFQSLAKKVKEFGTEKPVALAFAALTVGVAAGILMRRSLEQQAGTSFRP